MLLGKEAVVGVEDLPPQLTPPEPLTWSRLRPFRSRRRLNHRSGRLSAKCSSRTTGTANATADALGIKRTTLYKKMKSSGSKTSRWRCGGKGRAASRAPRL